MRVDYDKAVLWIDAPLGTIETVRHEHELGMKFDQGLIVK